MKPNWSETDLPTEFYPLAKEALREISSRNDVICILFTCSHPSEIEKYLVYFKSHGIHFSYVNENPEVINKKYGNYSKKPYFNVLFEDKAGFDPYTDWELVLADLKRYPETILDSHQDK